MLKLSEIYGRIDQFLFQKIDQLKSEQIFQQFIDKISTLGHSQQKILNQTITISCFLLPFLIVSMVFLKNCNIKSEINTKKEIIQLINKYSQKNSQFSAMSRQVLSPHKIDSKSSLNRRITNLLSRKKISTSKVTVNKFNKSDEDNELSKTEANMTFTKFSILELTSFLEELLQTERMRISSMNIKKNNKQNFLSGDINVIHYGKANAKRK